MIVGVKFINSYYRQVKKIIMLYIKFNKNIRHCSDVEKTVNKLYL